jgi:hypothetical protein
MFKRTKVLIGVTLGVAATIAFATIAWAGAKPNAGTADVDIIAVNPDSSESASVVVQFYSIDGTAGPTRNETLSALNAAEYTADSSGFSGSFSGVAVVSSNREVGVLATIKWEGGQTTDGVKYGHYLGVTEPSDTIYFPNVVYDTYQTTTGVQNTTMSVQNTSSSDVTAYASWTNEGGVQDFYYAITIPANGSVVMDTSNWDTSMADNVPDITSTAFWTTWDSWSGGVTITSTQPVLAGAANVTWRQWAASYAAVGEGDTTIYFPSAERREYDIKNNGRFGGGTSRWGGLSTVAVTNLDMSSSTVLTFTFIDSLGFIPNRTFTVPVAAGGTARFNTHTGVKLLDGSLLYDHDDIAAALDDYPSDSSKREWVGAVIVESDTPIVGTCNTMFLEFNKADLYEGVPAPPSGAPTLVVPYVVRSGSWNSDFSLLRIQNLAATTTTVNAHFYNQSGTDLLQFTNYEMAGYEAASPNLARSCYGDATTDCTRPWEAYVAGTGLGTGYKGWIVFTSDQPIAVTVETYFGGQSHHGMGAFNAMKYGE